MTTNVIDFVIALLAISICSFFALFAAQLIFNYQNKKGQ
jgi:hypothetical protein